ncbi:hypothetical protein MRX96_044657 [Rhipicephalus microplus]
MDPQGNPTSERISGVSQRKQSGNQHLPRLPIHDEKIILRPHGKLCLDRWTRPELANALWSAAGLTTKDREDIIFRLRPLQNLVIISTPQPHVVDALYRVRELRLGERVYPITTYFAALDSSCKGIVPGIVPDSRDPPFTHPDKGRRVVPQEPIQITSQVKDPL